jgi:hypothetical protein
MLFYSSLTATLFAIKNNPILTDYKYGMAEFADFSDLRDSTPTTEFFQASIGAEIGCLDCSGVRSGDVLLVPISGKVAWDEAFVGLNDVILEAPQNVLSLDLSCFTISNSNRSFDSNIEFEIIDKNSGFRTSFLDFKVSSFRLDTRELRTRRCHMIVREWAATTQIRFSLGEGGSPTRKNIQSILPLDKNCKTVGNTCLNDPLNEGFSALLLRAAYGYNKSTTNKIYSQNFHLFPDPANNYSDFEFAQYMVETIALDLILEASRFNNIQKGVQFKSDKVAVSLKVESWLVIITLVTGSVMVLFGTLLILMDVIKLGKTANPLLRRLDENLRPGKRNIEDVCQYVTDILESGVSDDWDLAYVKFGEDKATAKEMVGKLRYASKRDVIRFKLKRVYN